MQKETEDVAGEVGLWLVLRKLPAPRPKLWPTEPAWSSWATQLASMQGTEGFWFLCLCVSGSEETYS